MASITFQTVSPITSFSFQPGLRSGVHLDLHNELTKPCTAHQDCRYHRVAMRCVVVLLRHLQERINALVPAMIFPVDTTEVQLDDICSFLQKPFRGWARLGIANQRLNTSELLDRLVSEE